MFSFAVRKKLGLARLSDLVTPHGPITGPFFQFVVTRAAIRGGVLADDLRRMGVQIVLANTYHLHLRPGEDIVAEANGLHGFMGWDGPVTTDSGGYQVFSLSRHAVRDADSVTFRSPIDGSKRRFTPEKVMQIQEKLGADIVMPLDVCTPFKAGRREITEAVEQTTAWAKRCLIEHERLQQDRENKQALYGIVQGGVFPDLRERSAKEITGMGFFGYSIGGELREGTEKQLAEVVPMVTQHLPIKSPRYLMGYGQPADIVEAVRAGVDHFDCVLPVRNARHGQLFYDLDESVLEMYVENPDMLIVPEKLCRTVNITKSPFAKDFSPFSLGHPLISEAHTKAYVHHLLRAEPMAGMRLAVLHNIYFYARLMQAIRDIIERKGK